MHRPSSIGGLAIAWVLCAVGSHAAAQPRAVITPQEAQTPPYIDPQQFATPQLVAPSPANSGESRALHQLQTWAQAADATASQARQQQAQALWQLGLLYLHGQQVPLDMAQANRLFERAHALGHPLASAGLAWCAMDGCGASPQPSQARQWIETLQPHAPGRSAYLEWLLLGGLTPMDDAAKSTAPKAASNMQKRQQAALQRAIQANDTQARIERGMQLAESGKQQQALQQFRAVSAASKAAGHNAQVLGAQTKPETRPSGNLGQTGGAWQTFRQARVYHRGEGVPANYTEAIRLYQRASDMGSPQAKRMLALIYSRPQPDGNLDVAWMQQLAYADVSQDTQTLIHMPQTTNSLQRDPTPLYDYLDARWRR